LNRPPPPNGPPPPSGGSHGAPTARPEKKRAGVFFVFRFCSFPIRLHQPAFFRGTFSPEIWMGFTCPGPRPPQPRASGEKSTGPQPPRRPSKWPPLSLVPNGLSQKNRRESLSSFGTGLVEDSFFSLFFLLGIFLRGTLAQTNDPKQRHDLVDGAPSLYDRIRQICPPFFGAAGNPAPFSPGSTTAPVLAPCCLPGGPPQLFAAAFFAKQKTCRMRARLSSKSMSGINDRRRAHLQGPKVFSRALARGNPQRPPPHRIGFGFFVEKTKKKKQKKTKK